MAKQPEYEVEDWQTEFDAATDVKGQEQAMRDYEAAKMRNSARREEYRIERAIERSERRRAAFRAGAKKVQSLIDMLNNGAKKTWISFRGMFQKTK